MEVCTVLVLGQKTRLKGREVHPLGQQVGLERRSTGMDREAGEAGRDAPEHPGARVRRSGVG